MKEMPDKNVENAVTTFLSGISFHFRIKALTNGDCCLSTLVDMILYVSKTYDIFLNMSLKRAVK